MSWDSVPIASGGLSQEGLHIGMNVPDGGHLSQVPLPLVAYIPSLQLQELHAHQHMLARVSTARSVFQHGLILRFQPVRLQDPFVCLFLYLSLCDSLS